MSGQDRSAAHTALREALHNAVLSADVVDAKIVVSRDVWGALCTEIRRVLAHAD